MKGGNTSEILGFDYENVGQYGSFDMTGGKKNKLKKNQKFDDFDFEKEETLFLFFLPLTKYR